MIALRASRASDGDRLAVIWRAAMNASHGFLAPADRREIEDAVVDQYIPAVQFTVAEEGGIVLGFMDASDAHVDSLFVHPTAHGRGVGRMLMGAADADTVDVSEQNPGALGFYYALGYTVAGRSATDDGGRPYPILHLDRRTPSKAGATGLYRLS